MINKIVNILIIIISITAINCKKIYENSFMLDNEGWEIVGNKDISMPAIYEAYSISDSDNNNINRFIYGEDTLINTDTTNKDKSKAHYDKNLWYFSKKFIEPLNVSDAKLLQLTLYGLSGDFSQYKLNDIHSVPFVRIYGKKNEVIETKPGLFIFEGGIKTFNIPFLQTKAFNKNIGSYLIDNVLSHITCIEILGDWTQRYETVVLDNVVFL